MSRHHRAYLRHEIVPLIRARREVTITTPDGRRTPGHMATRTETPPGTMLHWRNGTVYMVDADYSLIEPIGIEL